MGSIKYLKALKVKKILISQPAPSSAKSPFLDLISKYKLEIDFRPFVRIEGVTVKEFRSQRVDILAYTAVIFTSRKTIDNFFRICEDCRVSVPESMKYFCVTESIALYLQKYIVYRKRKVFYGKATFADLMDVVIKHKTEKFLVALSDPHKQEIQQLLTRTGVKFTKIILAHSMPADLSDIAIDSYDLVACYSLTDIKALHHNFEVLPENLIVATLGNATAREALSSGLTVSIMAPTPKLPSLTMAIDKYIEALNAGESVDDFGIKEMPEVMVTPVSISDVVKTKAKPKRAKSISAASTQAKSTLTARSVTSRSRASASVE